MPAQTLAQIPFGSNVFIDANIFVYGLNRVSSQCTLFLERCSREEVTGITLYEIVNEATHQLMLAEAVRNGFISSPSPRSLRSNYAAIGALTDYWNETERILALNLLFLATEDAIVRGAQIERAKHCLLTNDSMIVSTMRNYGVSCVATGDKDFLRVNGIVVYSPDDLP